MISNKGPVSLIRGIFVSVFIGAVALSIWAWLVATHAIQLFPSVVIVCPGLFLVECFLISRTFRQSRLPKPSEVSFPNPKRLWRLPITYAIASVVAIVYFITKPSWGVAAQVAVGIFLCVWLSRLAHWANKANRDHQNGSAGNTRSGEVKNSDHTSADK